MLNPTTKAGAVDLNRVAAHPSVASGTGAAKRLLDLALAAAALLVFAPAMLLIALAIRLDSPGPVLFAQRRVGLGGQAFSILKFRSMRVDAEAQMDTLRQFNEMTGPLFKMKRDPRVTRVGRWLRATSLDELPQLFNVLAGEMSLVGPRPPLPSEVVAFKPHHHGKFEVRPGITGLWQVSGRSDITEFEQICALDLAYVSSWSLWLDLSILARTVPAVLLARGAR